MAAFVGLLLYIHISCIYLFNSSTNLVLRSQPSASSLAKNVVMSYRPSLWKQRLRKHSLVLSGGCTPCPRNRTWLNMTDWTTSLCTLESRAEFVHGHLQHFYSPWIMVRIVIFLSCLPTINAPLTKCIIQVERVWRASEKLMTCTWSWIPSRWSRRMRGADRISTNKDV